MEEQEYKGLLNRKQNISDVEEYFGEFLPVLRDITNYGSNLLVRCLGTSKRKQHDAIILGVMLRHAITMFDAIEILVSNSSVYPATLQNRALFEVSLYIDWVLKASTEERCAYYYVANLRQERMWALRSQIGSSENASFESMMAPFGDIASETSKQLFADGKKLLEEINAILTQSHLRPIDMAFEDYRKKHRMKYDPHWHALLGQKTVRQLAKDVERLHEYEMLYPLMSDVVHITSQKNHIKFSKGLLHIEPIRNLKNIDMLINLSMTIIFHIYRSILGYYRPGELQNFGRKYIEDWRNHFRNIPRIEYNRVEEGIRI